MTEVVGVLVPPYVARELEPVPIDENEVRGLEQLRRHVGAPWVDAAPVLAAGMGPNLALFVSDDAGYLQRPVNYLASLWALQTLLGPAVLVQVAPEAHPASGGLLSLSEALTGYLVSTPHAALVHRWRGISGSVSS